ncbi:hypothetical protein Q3G72_028137 [Acer saccharum]|nr:hypothetical protein Q3G72_028137 [Acer saccharum]
MGVIIRNSLALGTSVNLLSAEVVPRGANSVAHSLAQLALSLDGSMVWLDELILLGAVPFPADVPRLRELGVSGVVTLNEPYATLVPASLYHVNLEWFCHGFNSPYVGIDNEFGDMDPTNLENRFDETDSFSPIPWRSRSERMEFGENVGATAASRSHLRPLSIDETQFESMKSKSLWSTESFSSQASSVSDSPNGLSPSHVVTSELENLSMEELRKVEMEELGKGKSFRRSYPPDSKPENKKALLNAFHIRRYSTNGSLFEKNPRKSFEDDSRDMSKSKRGNPLSSDVGRSVSLNLDGNLKNLVKASSMRDTSKSKREDPLSSDVQRTVSSKFDGNPVNLAKDSSRDTSRSKGEDPLSSKFVGNPGNHVKASLRGRSVRTIRSRRYAAEAMKNEERGGNRLSYKLDQKASDEVEAMYRRRHEMINGGSNNLSSTGAKKQDLDYHRPVDTPKATFPELNKRKNRELLENLATEPKE